MCTGQSGKPSRELATPMHNSHNPAQSSARSHSLYPLSPKRSFITDEVHALMQKLEEKRLSAKFELVPGPYCEQVALISSGQFRMILSPHGAQMMNFIMLAPGTKVRIYIIVEWCVVDGRMGARGDGGKIPPHTRS